jgi:hypothetical protein
MKTAIRTNVTVIAITDEEMRQLQSTESAYADQLMPHLVTLTQDERLHLPKIGTGNIDFTGVALDYGQAHPDLVPSYVDIGVARSNLDLFNALRTLQQQRAVTDRVIEDTMMQCGSVAYTGGLGFYETTQAAARKGVLGAIAISQDLAARLPTRASRGRGGPKPGDGGGDDGGTGA